MTLVHPSSTRQVKQAFSTTLYPIPFTVLSIENKKGVNKESSKIEPTPKVSITINSRCRKLCVNDKAGVKAACGHCFTQRTRTTIDSIESGQLSHEVGYLAPSCPSSCCNPQSIPTLLQLQQISQRRKKNNNNWICSRFRTAGPVKDTINNYFFKAAISLWRFLRLLNWLLPFSPKLTSPSLFEVDNKEVYWHVSCFVVIEDVFSGFFRWTENRVWNCRIASLSYNTTKR